MKNAKEMTNEEIRTEVFKMTVLWEAQNVPYCPETLTTLIDELESRLEEAA